MRISGGAVYHPFFAFEFMFEAFARVAGWQQLVQLWELIVLVCKFVWGLLLLLGGGSGGGV